MAHGVCFGVTYSTCTIQRLGLSARMPGVVILLKHSHYGNCRQRVSKINTRKGVWTTLGPHIVYAVLSMLCSVTSFSSCFLLNSYYYPLPRFLSARYCIYVTHFLLLGLRISQIRSTSNITMYIAPYLQYLSSRHASRVQRRQIPLMWSASSPHM